MGLTLAPDSNYMAKAHTPGGPEIDLLIGCVRAAIRPADCDGLGELIQTDVNWAQLMWLAHRHGVLPSLHAALQGGAAADVPADIREQLRVYAEATSARNAEQREEQRRVASHLAAAGMVPALAFRAASQIASPHHLADQRESEPLDLLITGTPERAVRALTDLGYEPLYDLSPRQASAIQRTRGATVWHHPARSIRLQLWDRSAPISFAAGPGVLDLWQRRQPASDGGLATLSIEDLLIANCVNGSFQLWNRLVWIADVARLVAFEPIDWTRAVEIGRETHALRQLLLGLTLAHQLLAAPVPEAMLAQAALDPQVGRLADQVRLRLRRDLRGRVTEVERSRFRLAVLERLRDRVRYGAVFPSQPDLDDFDVVRVPDAMFPLYYLVRPAHLATVVVGRLLGRRVRAPFIPSPMRVVERMLEMANVQPGDVVYDLGCGDGRIVIAAAQRGARGVGVDLDARLISQARQNAADAGLDQRVVFIQGDALDVDLSPATVVTLWTVPDLNLQLRPRLRRQLQPGARVVGHSFDMGDWAPDRTELIQNGDDLIVAYVWTIPDGRADTPSTPRAQNAW